MSNMKITHKPKSAAKSSTAGASGSAAVPGAVKTRPTSGAVPAVPKKSAHKLVRDSFTIPKAEYVVLDELKVRAAALARPTKKSELLRAGIMSLQAMSDKTFLSSLKRVASLKTGRPKTVAETAKPTEK